MLLITHQHTRRINKVGDSTESELIIATPTLSAWQLCYYMHMEKILTEDNIDKIAKEIIDNVRKIDKKEATILAFSGDLGAGKTTLTKEISRQLGIKERVISPTFVIMKIYKTKDLKFKNLIHIDAYRLDSSKELLHLGWEEVIKNKENLIIVEWPERVPECLNKEVIFVSILHKDDTTRTIKVCYN